MPAHAFYRFFTGDYLRDAGHLSLLEHGCYRRLIDLYMVTRQPLPFDMPRLYRLLHATSKEEQQAVQVVIEEFFHMDRGVLRHSRCDRELQWQDGMSQAQAERAKLSWESRRKNNDLHAGALPDHSSGNASQSQSQNQNYKKKEKIKDSSAPPRPGFDEFWLVYPHFPQRSSKSKSGKRWAAMQLEPIASKVLETLQSCLAVPAWTKDGRSFVCAAEVWLEKRLWEQEPQTAAVSLLSRHSPTGQHMAEVAKAWINSSRAKESEK